MYYLKQTLPAEAAASAGGLECSVSVHVRVVLLVLHTLVDCIKRFNSLQ